MSIRLDVASFEHVDDLAENLEAFLVIKGFHQLAIVAKIVARQGDRREGLTASASAAERRYSDGQIVLLKLTTAGFDAEALSAATWSVQCKEPFGVGWSDGAFAFSSGSEVRVRTGHDSFILKSSWSSFVHTVEFSGDGQRLLVTCAGLDTILEYDLRTRKIVWEWNAWDHGFNESATGGKFVTRRADEAARFAAQHGVDRVIYVDRPERYPVEGLPTALAPLRVNGASYETDEALLVTAYQRPELLRICKDGTMSLIDLHLKHPHSFRCGDLFGDRLYSVVDSGRARFLTLDSEFVPVHELSFASLPCNEEKRATFGEWIQTVTIARQFGTELIFAVDALRVGVHVVDVAGRKRRFIPYPEQWSVQTLVPHPNEVAFPLS